MKLSDLEISNKIFLIRKIVDELNNIIDDVLTPSIEKLQSEINSFDEKIKNVENFTHCKSVQDVSDFLNTPSLLNKYVKKIEEMKIVFLYIKIEHIHKKILENVYPGIDIKDFHNFELMKKFFKTRNINLTKIVYFKNIDYIRLVNNEIKHSHSEIKDQKIFSIEEFKKNTVFNQANLKLFFENNRDYVKEYFTDLIERIIEEEYVFTDEKFDKIVKGLKNKLGHSELEYLKTKL